MRPRQRNPGVCPDIIGLVYRAASSFAAPEWPRQRNPDERSEIIRISVGLLTIRQIDLSRRNGIARPEPIAMYVKIEIFLKNEVSEKGIRIAVRAF